VLTGRLLSAFHVTGPKDVIDQGVTGYTDDTDLSVAIVKCLELDRASVQGMAKR
jgi:hypothetical protein